MAYGNPISNINVWKNWSPNTAPKIGGSGYLGGSNVLGSGGVTSAGTTPAPAPTPTQLGYNPISYSGQTAATGLGFPKEAPYQSARDAQGYMLAPYKASDSSKWQSLMNQKIQGDTAQGIDTAAATQASANQQALSNLMMRGGASGGAGERIGAAGAMGMMKAQQAQRQLGQQNLYDVAQKGELMNRESESQNIQRALQDLGGVNKYNEMMLDQNTKYQMGLDANPNAAAQASSKWSGIESQLANMQTQIKDQGIAAGTAPQEGATKRENGITYLYRNGQWILAGGQPQFGES